jgi:hypothetical protein
MKTMAKFVGCLMETCRVGGSRSLRGLYEITDPEGNTALYERHTSQIHGMGWQKTDARPTHGRVYGEVSVNGYYAAKGPHIWTYQGPETVEVEWKPRYEVLGINAAICLVGRAHVQSNLRGLEPFNKPACTVAEAMAPYTAENTPGWSLDLDTGHGQSTPCSDISAEVARVTAQTNQEFLAELEREVRARIPMRLPYRKVANKAELVKATIAFNCGITPDYYVPKDWEPSAEAWALAQSMMR